MNHYFRFSPYVKPIYYGMTRFSQISRREVSDAKILYALGDIRKFSILEPAIHISLGETLPGSRPTIFESPIPMQAVRAIAWYPL